MLKSCKTHYTALAQTTEFVILMLSFLGCNTTGTMENKPMYSKNRYLSTSLYGFWYGS